MQKVVLLILAGLICLFVNAQAPRTDKKLWQSWNEVIAESAKTNKPIFIDVYTDWCRYCKIMDATTYKNDSVALFLKSNFLRYKFNAETRDTITWNDKRFLFNPRFDTHDFAVYLTKGSIVYPTTVIITPGGQPFYKHGQISAGEMEMLLRYFAIPRSKEQTLDVFAKGFIPAWERPHSK